MWPGGLGLRGMQPPRQGAPAPAGVGLVWPNPLPPSQWWTAEPGPRRVVRVQADPRCIYVFGPECYSALHIVCMNEAGQEVSISKKCWEDSVAMSVGGWRWHTNLGHFRMHEQSRVELNVMALYPGSGDPMHAQE
jgi:hypothetical protein